MTITLRGRFRYEKSAFLGVLILGFWVWLGRVDARILWGPWSSKDGLYFEFGWFSINFSRAYG